MVSIRRDYITLPSGGQLHYRFTEPRNDQALVYLHQTAMSGRQWEQTMRRLGDTWTGVAFDTPGFGNSDLLPVKPEVSDYAEAFVFALDQLGIDTFAIIGHHTGSSLAVAIALAHPDRVTKLVLHSCPSGDDAFLEAKTASAAPMPWQADGSHLDAMRQRMLNYTTKFEPLDLHLSAMEYTSAQQTSYLAHLAIWKQKVREVVGRLSMPVLYLSGEFDDFPSEHEILKERTPNARSHVFTGKGRMTMNEIPDEYAEFVRAFLSEPVTAK